MRPRHQDLPRTLLVVDSDPAVRSALAFSLELDGFSVEGYASAEALIERGDLPRNACIVLDYQLPGMNGLELLRTLRERGTALPAILTATNPTRKLRSEARAAGAPIVEKPLLTQALEDSLRRVLDRPEAQARPPDR